MLKLVQPMKKNKNIASGPKSYKTEGNKKAKKLFGREK